MNIDDKLLDDLLIKAKDSLRLRMNMDLRNSVEDLSQRMLNALIPGTKVSIHRHKKTSETVILLKGNIDEIYYDDYGVETERFHLGVDGLYGLNIPRGQWHCIEVLESSVIIEVKDGPYITLGPEDTLDV